jgi:hypothetical protein
MPFQQKIYETIFFERIVSGVLDGTEKPAEGCGIGRRPKGIWLSNSPGRKEDIEDK